MGQLNNGSAGGLNFFPNAQPYPRAVVNQNASPQDFVINDASLAGAAMALVELILTPGASQNNDANVDGQVQIKGDTNNGGGGIANCWSRYDTVDGNRYNFTNYVCVLLPVTAGAITLTLINATAHGNYGSCEWRVIGVWK